MRCPEEGRISKMGSKRGEDKRNALPDRRVPVTCVALPLGFADAVLLLALAIVTAIFRR